jgi:lysophospholipase L1-like esterase
MYTVLEKVYNYSYNIIEKEGDTMKKFLSIILSLALIISVANFTAPASLKTKAAEADLVIPVLTSLSTVYSGVVVGDSIAEGHPFSHGRLHTNGVVNLTAPNSGHTIAKYLEDNLSVPMFNHGKGGQTTSNIKNRWSRDVLALTSTGTEVPFYSGKTLEKKPDFVIINCGINDIVTSGVTVNMIESNFTFFLESCKSNNIKPVIINLGVRNGTDAPLNQTQITMRSDINAWLLTQKNSGTYPGMELIDFYSWASDPNNNKYVAGSSTFNNTTGYIYDGLHPNEAGYDALSAKILSEANLSVYAPTPTPTPTPTLTPTPTPTPTPVAVTSVKLSKTLATLKVSQTLQLTATVSPVNAANKAIKWTTSNYRIATVSSTGKITARTKGLVSITATTVSGAKKAVCKVTVLQPVRSVKLSRTSLTLRIGKTYKLIATISPSNASNKRVTWRSTNTKIATVSSTGTIRAKAKGTVYIRVCTVDGKKTASCKVIVK